MTPHRGTPFEPPSLGSAGLLRRPVTLIPALSRLEHLTEHTLWMDTMGPCKDQFIAYLGSSANYLICGWCTQPTVCGKNHMFDQITCRSHRASVRRHVEAARAANEDYEQFRRQFWQSKATSENVGLRFNHLDGEMQWFRIKEGVDIPPLPLGPGPPPPPAQPPPPASALPPAPAPPAAPIL